MKAAKEKCEAESSALADLELYPECVTINPPFDKDQKAAIVMRNTDTVPIAWQCIVSRPQAAECQPLQGILKGNEGKRVKVLIKAVEVLFPSSPFFS